MGKVRRSTLIGLTLLLTAVAGCKVSCTTANISSLTFSKDKEGKVQTKEFAPTDTVHIKANIGNNGSNVTLKFNIFAEKVEGVAENTKLTKEDLSVEVPGNGFGTYDQPPPTGGWFAGRYRVEVIMLYNGDQKDKKSDTFTVTGGGAPPPGPAATRSPADETPPAEEDEDDNSENSSPHGEH